MSLVVCKLPKAGLGNQLFPLMKASVFAHLNNMEVRVTGYNRLKIGPYLRREKSKRKYSNSFTFQKNIISEQIEKWKIHGKGHYELISEPDVVKLPETVLPGKLFVFTETPHYRDLFAGLREQHELVKTLFWNVLQSSVKKRLEKLQTPYIGVHVRMGDFPSLKEGENFNEVGQKRTPETYFIDIITRIREVHGSTLPVTVFTDGYRHEFNKLFELENIEMAEGNPDIIDLLLLSRSKIIVTATGSTFSYWAGFLSEAPVILHPDHIHQPHRGNPTLYEGALDVHNDLLVQSIRSIPYHQEAYK